MPKAPEPPAPEECELDKPKVYQLDPDDIENNVHFVHQVAEKQGQHPTPIDIDVVGTTKIDLPMLEWHHYDVMPRKMRLINTGKTRKHIDR